MTPRTRYGPVLRQPLFRRLLPGLAVSALGDGMSVVAVTWLALQLAPPDQRGTWVAAAVAAYSLPSAAGAVALGRWLRGRPAAQLVVWSSTLRALALGAIPVVYAFGGLSIGVYVALLSASSLLHSWGSAGRFTVVVEILPPGNLQAGNAVLTTIAEAATIVGPPLAGLLVVWTGGPVVVALDAATFAVLALTYRIVLPRSLDVRSAVGASGGAGFGAIRRNSRLFGLLTLSCGFFFLYGPIQVALPLYLIDDLHGSAALLGVYYTAFSIGAVAGGLVAGYLRWRPQWILVTVVIGFGASLLPIGLGVPTAAGLVAFAVGGAIWGPYMSLSMLVFQQATPPAQLPAVLAANSAVLITAVPLGTLLGGPLTAALGARQTVLASAISTIVFGIAAAGFAALNSTTRLDHADSVAEMR